MGGLSFFTLQTKRLMSYSIRLCLISLLTVCSLLIGCQPEGQAETKGNEPVERKIVSLNGTFTEILFEIGLGQQIVGVDVTSTYPEATAQIPKVGHNRNIAAEGVLSLAPDLIIGRAGELKPEVEEQLRASGIDVILLTQDYSVAGSKRLIQQVCDTMGHSDKATALIQEIDKDLAQVQPLSPEKSALFIYARGTGTLMVAGENTQMQQIIALSGAQNAIQGFEDFKPLSSEALVEANPDVILLFTSGLNSLEGPSGLLNVPGVAETQAGKDKAFVSMDGQLLSGFGPRVGQAILALNQAFHSPSAKM